MRPDVSEAAERVYDALEAYQEDDDLNGYPLLHFCEAMVRMASKAREALTHDDIGSGLRRLYDPQRAPEWFLPRLRWLVGNDDQGLTGQALRDSIEQRPHASRCTLPALRSAVLRTLAPGATDDDIRVFERDGGSPYRLTVMTPTALTLDPDQTYRAARAHKPLFVLLSCQVSDSPRWDDGARPWQLTDGTWDTVTLQDVT